MCDCAMNINYKEDVMRAQPIRLWDVFAIGPILILMGLFINMPVIARMILIGIGAGTIIYNGSFYLKYKNA